MSSQPTQRDQQTWDIHVLFGHKNLIVTCITIKKLKLITRCPEASLMSISAIGIGYSSFGVALSISLESL
jgi:hypothetical protein